MIKNARARISRASLFRLALPGLIVSICGLSTGIQLLGAGIAFDQYESYLETSKGHLAALRASGDINYVFNYTPFMIDAVLLKPANLDFVWIRARQRADYLSVQTSLLASLVLGAGWFAASAWLLDRVTRQRDLLVVGCASLLAVGWSSANLLAVAYADERYPSANYQAAALWLSQEALPGDGLLLELQVRNWFQTASYFLNYLREPNLAMYSLGRPVEQISTAQVAEQLRPLVTRHHSLWLHVESTPPGDPANQFERWLTNNEFLLSCEWFNQYSRLCLYSVDRQSGTTRIDLNVLEGTQIRLVGAVIGADSDSAHPLITHPGADIQLAMNWTALDSVHHAYKVFIQLIDAGGKLRQQIDREPVNSFRPTNRWTAGDEIQDRYAMRLGGLEPGKYRIIAGLYDAETIVRLPVRDAQGQLLGDFVDLAVLDVR